MSVQLGLNRHVCKIFPSEDLKITGKTHTIQDLFQARSQSNSISMKETRYLKTIKKKKQRNF